MLAGVKVYNADTFTLGAWVIQGNHNIEFTYMEPPFPHPLDPIHTIAAYIGIVRGDMTKPTAFNTLILKPDCKTVVTSFPGLPGQ